MLLLVESVKCEWEKARRKRAQFLIYVGDRQPGPEKLFKERKSTSYFYLLVLP